MRRGSLETDAACVYSIYVHLVLLRARKVNTRCRRKNKRQAEKGSAFPAGGFSVLFHNGERAVAHCLISGSGHVKSFWIDQNCCWIIFFKRQSMLEVRLGLNFLIDFLLKTRENLTVQHLGTISDVNYLTFLQFFNFLCSSLFNPFTPNRYNCT